MSISSVTGAALVTSSTADSSAGGAQTARIGNTEHSTPTSEYVAFVTSAPTRFPWLSRLSEQLDPVAKQKPAFPSAPVLGDNIDKSA